MERGREARLLELPDGGGLCWAQYGDPDGTPIFLFHGNPGSRLAWGAMPGSPFVPGVRIVAPDRPGYGRTDFKPRAVERWPRDVAALADHLEIERFAVFGASGGAPYALACAWRMPERLTAVGVFGAVGPNAPEAVEGVIPSLRVLWRVARPLRWAVRAQMWAMARAVQKDPVAVVARLRDLELREEDRPVIDRPDIMELFRVDLPEAYRQNGIGSAYDATIPANWPIPLEGVRAEVHLWHAECDPLVGNMTRYIASRLPKARLHTLPRAGHLWILDHMPEVVGTLLA